MRRGRALLPHPEPVRDDTDRVLATRQVIVFLTGMHLSMVRRHLDPVACHVVGKVPLYDVKEAQKLADEKVSSSA